MLDDSAVLLLRARQKSRNVFKRNQRNVEGIAEAHKACALYRRVDVERACQKRRLIRHHAHRPSIQPREAHHQIFCKVLMHLKKISIVEDGMDGIFDVVGFVRFAGDQRIQLFIGAIGRIVARAPWRIVQIVRRQKAQQLADER